MGGRPDGMARRAGCSTLPLSPVFELYQNARTRFVQMVAEQATRPQNIETLQNAGEPAPRMASWPHTSSRIHPRSSLPPSAGLTRSRVPLLAPAVSLLAPLPAQLLGALGMGLSASNFLRTLSSPRELVGEAEKMEEAWYRCFHLRCKSASQMNCLEVIFLDGNQP